jgi:hypothetical protein
MTETLKVYGYNVGFGDGVLLEVPDGSATRWVLIDVGNVLRGTGGDDQALIAAVTDIARRTGGAVDLYIMTHEHLDHVQGLPAAAAAGVALGAHQVWMTASAAPDYYERHPQAREQKLALEAGVQALVGVLGASAPVQPLQAVLALNSARTKECVEHLRRLAPQPPAYLYRGAPLGTASPFVETTVRILAPEEDTSVYYGPARPHLAAAAIADGPGAGGPPPVPPPGVHAGAFYDLIEQMDRGFAEVALQIDQAANNTSLVVELTWRGRRLLFVGDAEQRSWRTMAAQEGLLRPVDFFKVGHHGSRNATPPPAILDQCLPATRRDQAVALVSTCADVYPGVPHVPTLAAVRERVSVLYATADALPGQPVVIEIPPGE